MHSPAPPEDDWDAHWERYADSAVRNPAQGMRHDFIARLLGEAAAGQKVRILDLGSGQGDLLKKLSKLLPEALLLGTEMSEKGVAISRQKVPRASFIVADIFHPPPSCSEYLGWATHAVCSEVLEHVDNPISFLEHARQYLAPQATLIVTVPGGPISAFDRHIGHRRHFDRKSIRETLEQAGYSVERVYATGFPFFNLYRLSVIAAGQQVQSGGASSILATCLMRAFRFLFHGNFLDSRFGWQLVAVARNTSV